GVNGTVRAALCTIPAVFAVGLGDQFALALVGALAKSRLMAWAVSSVNSPFRYDAMSMFANRFHRNLGIELVFVPSSVFALVQSRRHFRREVPEGISSTLKYLVTPAIAVFVAAFCVYTVHSFWVENWLRAVSVIEEVHKNVKNLKLDVTNTSPTSPRYL